MAQFLVQNMASQVTLDSYGMKNPMRYLIMILTPSVYARGHKRLKIVTIFPYTATQRWERRCPPVTLRAHINTSLTQTRPCHTHATLAITLSIAITIRCSYPLLVYLCSLDLLNFMLGIQT